MGKWTSRLGLKNTDAPPKGLTKPTEAPFGSNVSAPPGASEKNKGNGTKSLTELTEVTLEGSEGSEKGEIPRSPDVSEHQMGELFKNSNAKGRLLTKPTKGTPVSNVSSYIGACQKIRDEVLHIHSRTLGTDLWVVPDGWTGDLDGPVYTDTEVQELHLQQVTPEQLKQIHAAKVAIDGEVCQTFTGFVF